MSTNLNSNTNTNTLDINKLENALDNSKNESIMNFTTKKIMELNLKILQELKLDKKTTIDYLKKLKEYKFVDELTDLKHGAYIRWIPITNSDYLPLNQCGIVCDIKIADEGVFVVCKNFMHRHYNFKMDDVLIFQKLTNQELIILSALDHLDSNEDIKEIEKEDLEEDLEDEDLEEDD